MNIFKFLIFILLLSSCEDAKPHAARSGNEGYWHPIRAKVVNDGVLMTFSGFIGRDESGGLLVNLSPVDHYQKIPLTEESKKVHWMMWKFEKSQAFYLWSVFYSDDSRVVHSSVLAMTFDPSSESENIRPWALWLHDTPKDWVVEPNGKEWRITRTREEFEEVAIFGKGGPWNTRPADAFRQLEETSLGSFSLDGVPLIKPYWSIVDWREEGTQESDS